MRRPGEGCYDSEEERAPVAQEASMVSGTILVTSRVFHVPCKKEFLSRHTASQKHWKALRHPPARTSERRKLEAPRPGRTQGGPGRRRSS